MEFILTEQFVSIYWKYVALILAVEVFVGWKMDKGMMGMLAVQIIAFALFPLIIPYLMVMS